MKRVRPRKEKRRATGKIILVTLLFFLLFPYLSSLMGDGGKEEIVSADYVSDTWVEVDRLWGKERIPLEEYLVGMMAATISLDNERETLKAQAIMLRSWCYSLAGKEDGYDIIPGGELEEVYLSPSTCQRIWKEEMEANHALIREILEETEGMVLVWQGQIIAPPFFQISSGMTRAVGEYQAHANRWSYVRTTVCPQDVEAKDYLGRVELSRKEFEKKVGRLLGEEKWTLDKIILHRDLADYVKTVEIGEKKIQGEEFRYALELNSACFTLEKQNNTILIKTRGIGHGFGFSQYQANELAKQGQTYRQLLETFFSEITIEKF
ncbi:MAG: SpoIID/LytB domain-containing protein [Lachnospiraceae bacterium]